MRKIQIGARISHDDAEFISRLEIEGAHTPSDKLRAIIEKARKEAEVPRDFAGSYRMMKDELNPLLELVKKTEHREGLHSAILARILEWMPEFYAACLAAAEPGEGKRQDLPALEKDLTARLFRLFESLLHLELSRQQMSYTPHVARDHFASVKELLQIVDNTSQEGGRKQ